MQPTTEILSWERARLSGRRALIIDPPEPAALQLLDRDAGSLAWFTHRGRFVALADEPDRFGLPVVGDFEVAVLFVPKGREHLLLLATQALARLPVGGELLVVGHNSEGGKSAARALRRAFGYAEKLVSARHCTLSLTRRPAALQQLTLRHWEQEFEAGVRLVSLPGGFAHGRLDEGTRVLLEHLPDDLEGPLLDVGCGAGVLGIRLALDRADLVVQLSDVSALADWAARRNVDRLGLADRVIVIASDGYDELGRGYGAIVSNPPFHQGVATELGVTTRLIEQAPQQLRPGGRLVLVANRFLPWPAALDRAFGAHERLYEDPRYLVLTARRSA